MDETTRATRAAATVRAATCLALSVVLTGAFLPPTQAPEAAEGAAPAEPATTFVERIPGTTVAIEAVRVPEGVDAAGAPVGGFLMATTEITWDAFDVMLFGYDEVDERLDADGFARPSKPYVAVDRGFGHNGHPALSMSFRGAEAFCAWLSAKTGRRWRLPTEAEWEHAALAGSAGPWCFGDDPTELGRFAWFADNAEGRTHPVGARVYCVFLGCGLRSG